MRRGSAAAAGRWPTSRAASPIAPISIGSCPIGPSTSRLATGTRPGSTAWPWRAPGSRPRPPIRVTDGSSATPRDARSGRSRRVRRVPVYDVLPADTDEELVAGLRLAQAELHALGITNWQDAQVEPATDVAYTTMADRGELTARVVGALSWDETRGDEQIEELVERRAGRLGRATRRRASSSLPMGSSRTSRAPCWSRTSTAMGCPPRTSATASSSPPPSGRPSRGSMRSGSRSTSMPSAIAPCATRSTPSRSRGGPTVASDTRPQIAHLQLVHPDDLGRFRALGVVADVQAYWAVLEDQMEELTIPFVGPERAGRMYPIRVAAAGGRDDRDGVGLERLDGGSAAPDGGGGRARQRRAPRPAAGLPARRADRPRRRAGGLHPRLGLGQPPRRARSDRSRSARRPTSRCSIATCSIVGRVRSARPG